MIPHPDLDVLGNTGTLLLGDGREDRDHQLPGGFQRVHGFLLKDDGDVQGFQLPDVVQRVQRVAGEM